MTGVAAPGLASTRMEPDSSAKILLIQGVRVRAAMAGLVLAMLAGGCSDNKVTPPSSANSAEILKRDCADPKWKEQNLGLWYSVCRQPMRW